MGVDRDVTDEALEGLDEETSAIQAGRKLLRRLQGADFNTVRNKLGGYLKRRGFNYSVVASATHFLWLELTNPIHSYVESGGQEKHPAANISGQRKIS